MRIPLASALSRQATEYLVRLGHTRIGIVTGTMTVATTRERLDGYLAALTEAGIAPDSSLVVPGGFTAEGGYAATMKLWNLLHRPTAIISFHNVMTLGLLKALRDSDARVPDDVSVISFGDQPCFPLIDPPLTAVVQPMYELGHDACYLLLKMIQDTAGSKSAAQTRLPIQLIV